MNLVLHINEVRVNSNPKLNFTLILYFFFNPRILSTALNIMMSAHWCTMTMSVLGSLYLAAVRSSNATAVLRSKSRAAVETSIR